ncbi:anthrax toxin lethal factor-related metalloendopeptidase [Candidatus Xianfuyuplasma coldseepsis]|uniref:DUF5011 domain-containing protein n=1 Tax=Candidatus Xianfuyuplasma coldseepsis TaxID=2782163 RepID=A0A7L7KSG3_9MOLU|nr:immunoglobulin-like domain-containing protein [Xianfuyuplasma coldseepsis]QMS85657.1 DUF5011 domain-containing protein [Xianfuyuplasma coldseepsis]
MKKLSIITLLLLMGLLVACNPDKGLEQDPPIIEEEDTTPPIITLLGGDEVIVVVGDHYYEYGAEVTDDVDSDLIVTISGEVNTEEYGTYDITYTAVDSSGNVATPVTRTVIVGNRRPGIMSSYTYEYYDRVGINVSVLDFMDSFDTLFAYLYQEDTLVDTIELENGGNSFEFTGLEEGVDYTYYVAGSYDLGEGLGTRPFGIDPISVGTYRDIPESLRETVGDDRLFDALKDIIHLPYDQTNAVITNRMILEVAKVDTELIVGSAYLTEDNYVFVDGYVTEAYDNFDLKGVDARGHDVTFDQIPGVCCFPMTVKIGYSGSSVNIVLHEFGHSIDLVLLYGLSFEEEFLSIHFAEKELIFPGDDYMDYPEEYFAESFAYYYDSESSNTYLLEHAPQTHAFIESLVKRYQALYGEEYTRSLGE